MGCALVLISLAMAATPAAPARAGDADALHASPWAATQAVVILVRNAGQAGAGAPGTGIVGTRFTSL